MGWSPLSLKANYYIVCYTFAKSVSTDKKGAEQA